MSQPDLQAQLRRLVADAKRAEAMVRREVGRAIADARTCPGADGEKNGWVEIPDVEYVMVMVWSWYGYGMVMVIVVQ